MEMTYGELGRFTNSESHIRIMIKNALKRIIVKGMRLLHIEWGSGRDLNLEFQSLPTEEIFEKIYMDGMWGKNDQGLATSGPGSHNHDIVGPYIEAVHKITRDYGLKTAVDLGCGDFAVGSQIYELYDRYIACDISQTILRRNLDTFQSPSLEFRRLNLATDRIPTADIVFVRQVLQHLSNQEIKSFVDQIHKEKFCRYLLITEHLPAAKGFPPNFDHSTGPNNRLGKGSGIVLHRKPFNLRYKELHDVFTVKSGVGTHDVIKSVLYVLS